MCHHIGKNDDLKPLELSKMTDCLKLAPDSACF